MMDNVDEPSRSGHPMPRSRAPSDFDKIVTGRLREARIARGLSRAAVARLLGVTFQQLQRYEDGYNRITVDRLNKFAQALGIAPSWFFSVDDRKRAPMLMNSAEEQALAAFRLLPPDLAMAFGDVVERISTSRTADLD